jgi:hypothetical protein
MTGGGAIAATVGTGITGGGIVIGMTTATAVGAVVAATGKSAD